jgi:phytoene desaturase
MKNKNVSIVGAGVGGLATAARLAQQGLDVTVYEKLPKCGGRAHIIEDKGFKFDTGPSFVMMPDFFKEFFTSCRVDINDYLDLKPLDIHYKIFYADGDTFTVYRDCPKTEAELERIEKGSARKFRKFIQDTKTIYDEVENLFYQSFSPSALLKPAHWKILPKLKLNKTYWNLAKDYFKSDKLCFAFTFEAMFIGVSPFTAPSLYSVIAYTDHVHKIYHPMGGMYRIPQAMEHIAKKYGARVQYNTPIRSIKRDEQGFRLCSNGDTMRADQVVVNADLSHTLGDLLERRVPGYDYSCSVYLMYWGTKEKIPNLEHHNLFFAKDPKENLNNIFRNKIDARDFSFYVHVPTVTDTSLAPPGKDILYTLVPVPNLRKGNKDFTQYEGEIRQSVLNKLRSVTGVDVEPLIEVEHKFYPEDFIKRYNIKYGATFGLAHTLRQSGFLRPMNYDRKWKDLYYVGASVQPGGGLPPVIASSRIVSDLIRKNAS